VTVSWEEGVRDPVRLAALERSGLAGTGPEDAFDRLIELAAELVGVPRGVITLVDAERTVAKSILGFPEGSPSFAPIEQSFCRFVVASGRPLIVNDAREDPRTRGDPAIAAYDAATWAGYPIEDADGMVLGTFCLMDANPHEWTSRDLHILATLAKAASSEIALHRARVEAAARREEIGSLLTWLGFPDGAPAQA
jgi:sigma-B regulation protein RsbU (phosphoserine phosphatase)